MAITFDANLGTVTDTATLTTSSAAAAGSRVILFVGWYDAAGTCTGCSGGGLTWVVDLQALGTFGGDNRMAILSADAPSGLASSTNITPTFSAAADFGPGLAAASFTGMQTGASGYVDDTAALLEDFERIWVTNEMNTTMADTLLVGFSMQFGSTITHTATGPIVEMHQWDVQGSTFGATVYRIVTFVNNWTLGGEWATGVSFQQNIAVAYEAGVEVAPTLPTPSYRTFPKQKIRERAGLV